MYFRFAYTPAAIEGKKCVCVMSVAVDITNVPQKRNENLFFLFSSRGERINSEPISMKSAECDFNFRSRSQQLYVSLNKMRDIEFPIHCLCSLSDTHKKQRSNNAANTKNCSFKVWFIVRRVAFFLVYAHKWMVSLSQVPEPRCKASAFVQVHEH